MRQFLSCGDSENLIEELEKLKKKEVFENTTGALNVLQPKHTIKIGGEPFTFVLDENWESSIFNKKGERLKETKEGEIKIYKHNGIILKSSTPRTFEVTIKKTTFKLSLREGGYSITPYPEMVSGPVVLPVPPLPLPTITFDVSNSILFTEGDLAERVESFYNTKSLDILGFITSREKGLNDILYPKKLKEEEVVRALNDDLMVIFEKGIPGVPRLFDNRSGTCYPLTKIAGKDGWVAYPGGKFGKIIMKKKIRGSEVSLVIETKNEKYEFSDLYNKESRSIGDGTVITETTKRTENGGFLGTTSKKKNGNFIKFKEFSTNKPQPKKTEIMKFNIGNRAESTFNDHITKFLDEEAIKRLSLLESKKSNDEKEEMIKKLGGFGDVFTFNSFEKKDKIDIKTMEELERYLSNKGNDIPPALVKDMRGAVACGLCVRCSYLEGNCKTKIFDCEICCGPKDKYPKKCRIRCTEGTVDSCMICRKNELPYLFMPNNICDECSSILYPGSTIKLDVPGTQSKKDFEECGKKDLEKELEFIKGKGSIGQVAEYLKLHRDDIIGGGGGISYTDTVSEIINATPVMYLKEETLKGINECKKKYGGDSSNILIYTRDVLGIFLEQFPIYEGEEFLGCKYLEFCERKTSKPPLSKEFTIKRMERINKMNKRILSEEFLKKRAERVNMAKESVNLKSSSKDLDNIIGVSRKIGGGVAVKTRS